MVSQKGALFAWRTISGEEASAYYAAGTAQYHINAAIAHGIVKYVDVTGDRDFLYECGAEILVETARLWYDLGFFSERKDGRFCIHRVTGPDEYTTVVNNNTYTNLMARRTCGPLPTRWNSCGRPARTTTAPSSTEPDLSLARRRIGDRRPTGCMCP